MTAQARITPGSWNLLPAALFAVGLLLLLAVWAILFWWVTLFTEALLVPWYCCSLESMPDPGTWQRTVNDFFNTVPGSILPSVAIVLTGVLIFIARVKRAQNKAWLPLIFACAYMLLLAADVLVTNLSWELSNWLVGPRVGGIDAGYHRTWYGIVTHLALWITFYLFMAKTKVLQR